MILVLNSCKTIKDPEPELVTPSFPEFPTPYVEGVSVVTFDEASGNVSMPLWYWKAIVRYKVDVDTAQTVINQ